MRKRMTNFTCVEGLIYEHKLEVKESGPNSKNPGTKYISGTIDIATDNDCVNIVPVHYTYVTATTSRGSANPTYSTLLNVIDGKLGTIMADGKENAAKVHIDSALGLNEFYSDRNGTDELVSVKRNEGGFIHVINTLNEKESARSSFKCDIVITNVRTQEANEERGLPEKVIVKGAIFDFRNALLPVEFSVLNDNAKDYFLGLGISPSSPVFTTVWGQQVSETVVRNIVEESAFGEDYVRTVTNTRKDFVITGASSTPYEWDTDETITAKELSDLMTERETYLATLKKNRDDYRNRQGRGNVAPIKSSDEFNF